MAGIHAGTDTYGRVKKVGSTTVVTKFAMLYAIPIWPVESYFYAAPGQSRFKGVPFFGGLQTTEIRGMPLAHIDRFSVLIAYLRGLFGGMVVVGCMWLIVFLVNRHGPPPDDFARTASYVLLTGLCVGALGGLLTYCVPFQVTQRERMIRETCAEVLTMCIDPAQLRRDVAQRILSALADPDVSSETAARSAPHPARAPTLPVRLARVRAVIALGHERAPLEVRTDEILAQLVNGV
jgi:hypothetical protein